MQTTMLFSEADQEWRPVPHWVEFLIRLGYDWPDGVSGQRRIALVSMPCDSAAASLIALGALIRDLGNPNANDIDGHYDSLLRYARQYLQSCSLCDMPCDPGSKNCGYAAQATGWVRYQHTTRYRVSERTSLRNRHLAFVRGKSNLTRYPLPEGAIDWQIAGDPPVRLTNQDGALPEEAYGQIVDRAPILHGNLLKSFSGLCLAGRVAGKTATREVCGSVRFRGANGEYALPELLTVQEWAQSNAVSRMNYFNARTEQFDRQASAPALVVADGDASILKTLRLSAFQRSDVIGAVHRTMERGQLEAIGNRVHGLRQWYAEDYGMLGRLPAAPRGISVLILVRGAS